MLPVASQVCHADATVQKQIVQLLWDALLDVDELSPSIGELNKAGTVHKACFLS